MFVANHLITEPRKIKTLDDNKSTVDLLIYQVGLYPAEMHS